MSVPIQQHQARKMPAHKKKKRRKLSSSGLLALLLLSVILILILAILLIQLPIFQRDKLPSLEEQETLTGSVVMELDAVEAAETYPLGDQLLLSLKGGQLRILNLMGTEEFSSPVDLQQPVVENQGQRSLLYEKGGYAYFVFQQSSLLYQGTATAPLLSAALSSDGHLALLTQPEDSKGEVVVLDPTGKTLLTWTLQNETTSGYLLAASFDTENQSVYVSMLNTAGSTPAPVIRRLRIAEGEEERLLSQYRPKTDETLPLIFPFTQNRVILAGPHSLWSIQAEEMKELLSKVSLARAGQMMDSYYVVAAVDSAGPYFLHIQQNLDTFPDLKEGYELPSIPQEVQRAGTYLVLRMEDNLYRFNQKSPRSPDIFSMQGKVLRFTVDDRGGILAVCSDGVRKLLH